MRVTYTDTDQPWQPYPSLAHIFTYVIADVAFAEMALAGAGLGALEAHHMFTLLVCHSAEKSVCLRA